MAASAAASASACDGVVAAAKPFSAASAGMPAGAEGPTALETIAKVGAKVLRHFGGSARYRVASMDDHTSSQDRQRRPAARRVLCRQCVQRNARLGAHCDSVMRHRLETADRAQHIHESTLKAV